ncbi:uncharacterized protein [Haliotis cracherodii]|uniref:uncharacterized protein n=1 Tax=Haliotis cracherodii TaxID=6455 RepID=UPI0039EBC786
MMWSTLLVLCLAAVLDSVHGQLALCQEAPLVANIGYRYSTSECGHYLQCHTRPASEGTGTIVVYRTCQHGYYWNQDLKECRPNRQITCPIEKCSTVNARHFKMEGSSCRAHWTCSGFRSTAECCSPGFRYVPEQGCIGDLTCLDPCPGTCGLSEICRSVPDWTRSEYYFHYELERGTWNRYERKCPLGNVFDVLECGCTKPVRQDCTAEFRINFSFNATDDFRRAVSSNVDIRQGTAQFRNGSSYVINNVMPTPTLERPMFLKFRYNEAFRNGTQRNLFQIQDNIQCNAMTIDLNNELIEIALTHLGNTQASLVLSTRRFTDFVDVAVMYTGREIVAVARSGSMVHINRVSAPSYRLMNSIRVASSAAFPFYGSFDDLALYNCHPAGRVVDLLNYV